MGGKTTCSVTNKEKEKEKKNEKVNVYPNRNFFFFDEQKKACSTK